MESHKITPEKIRRVVREVLDEALGGGARPAGRPRGPGDAGAPGKETGKADASVAAAARGKAKTRGSCVLAIGADHGGFAFKELLKKYLEQELELIVKDCGTHGPESVDYPDFALAVARAVASGECERGIVIDTMGIGSSIAANKVRGIRAALCHDVATAKNSRAHNDANVLALGSRVVNSGHARRIVREWLATPFEGGRHAKRVQKIVDAERS
jgi:ribose 5-phosphate isomerase B